MTTPTIFSDVAINPLGSKFVPQGNISQKAIVSVPATTATGVDIGMIPFQKGFRLLGLQVKSDDLDTSTNVTLDVGFLLDGTTGEDDNAFFSASTIAQGGTAVVWPSDSAALLVGISFEATGDGFISITTGGGATTTLGDITVIATFTYDL